MLPTGFAHLATLFYFGFLLLEQGWMTGGSSSSQHPSLFPALMKFKLDRLSSAQSRSIRPFVPVKGMGCIIEYFIILISMGSYMREEKYSYDELVGARYLATLASVPVTSFYPGSSTWVPSSPS